jgi:hypothetical protein
LAEPGIKGEMRGFTFSVDTDLSRYAARYRTLAAEAVAEGEDGPAKSYLMRAEALEADTLEEIEAAYRRADLMHLYEETLDSLRDQTESEHDTVLAIKTLLVSVGFKMAREHITDRMRGRRAV